MFEGMFNFQPQLIAGTGRNLKDNALAAPVVELKKGPRLKKSPPCRNTKKNRNRKEEQAALVTTHHSTLKDSRRAEDLPCPPAKFERQTAADYLM